MKHLGVHGRAGLEKLKEKSVARSDSRAWRENGEGSPAVGMIDARLISIVNLRPGKSTLNIGQGYCQKQ